MDIEKLEVQKLPAWQVIMIYAKHRERLDLIIEELALKTTKLKKEDLCILTPDETTALITKIQEVNMQPFMSIWYNKEKDV